MFQSVFNFFKELISGRVLKGQARTLFAAFGGYLLAKGVSAETVAQFIDALTKLSDALIPIVIASVFSAVDKFKSVSDKELKAAGTGTTVKDVKIESK